MKVYFHYYMNEDAGRFEVTEFLSDSGVDYASAEEIANARFFDEVDLYCEYDTESKELTILDASV